MINNDEIQDSLSRLANRVEAFDRSGAIRLRLLSDAIKNYDNSLAEAWAVSDVYKIISPDLILSKFINSKSLSSLITNLQAFRSSLIVLPFIVLIFAFEQASAAYNILIQNSLYNNDTKLYSLPFLYLWQQAFDGLLPPIFSLSSVAFVEAILLFFILMLTLAISTLSRVMDLGKKREADALREDLTHTLAGASLYLLSRQQDVQHQDEQLSRHERLLLTSHLQQLSSKAQFPHARQSKSKQPLPKPIRIFISHSHRDNEFGKKLVSDLRQMLNDDDAVWYDSHGGLRGGSAWWSTIRTELTARYVFLVILSPDAVDSQWVNDEIDLAWQQKNSSAGKCIIPVLYRPCTIREDLSTIQAISFESSRDYRDAFKELLITLELPKEARSLK